MKPLSQCLVLRRSVNPTSIDLLLLLFLHSSSKVGHVPPVPLGASPASYPQAQHHFVALGPAGIRGFHSVQRAWVQVAPPCVPMARGFIRHVPCSFSEPHTALCRQRTFYPSCTDEELRATEWRSFLTRTLGLGYSPLRLWFQDLDAILQPATPAWPLPTSLALPFPTHRTQPGPPTPLTQPAAFHCGCPRKACDPISETARLVRRQISAKSRANHSAGSRQGQ